jgi:hypothetical protein
MKSVREESGKHKSQDSKHGTENHKTHDRQIDASICGPQNEYFVLSDAKPKTLDPEPETPPLWARFFDCLQF